MKIEINFDKVEDLFNEKRIIYQIEQAINQHISNSIYYRTDFEKEMKELEGLIWQKIRNEIKSMKINLNKLLLNDKKSIV
jgi:hypothetical protein